MSVAFGIQHSLHKLHIAICGLSGATIFFHAISQIAQFKKKVIEDKRLPFPLQLLSETLFIPQRTEGDMITNVHRSSNKLSIILVRL